MKKKKPKATLKRGHEPPTGEHLPLPMLSTRRRIAAALAVLLLSFIFNCIGINWGICGFVPWQADSIEGITTVRELPKMFTQWTYKYPRGQFIINGIAYYPFLKYWEKHSVTVKNSAGQMTTNSLTQPRLEVLAKISRWIVVAMSLSGVFALMLTVWNLFYDFPAAISAGFTLSTSYLYIFFSHLGNVDIPSLFWFLWASYFGLRAIQKQTTLHWLMVGFCAAWMVCTKEGPAIYLLGLGLSLWLMHGVRTYRAGHSRKYALLALWTTRVWIAVISFFVIFLLLNGFWAGAGEFQGRLHSWERVTGSFLNNFHGQKILLWTACKQLYYGIGWPFLLVALIATFYFWFAGFRNQLFFALAPLVFYYVLVITRIHLCAPRFLLGGYPGICILVGKTVSDWLRQRRFSLMIRSLPVITIYGLSLLYCIGLVMEMCSDTRERTENWVQKNISKQQIVVSTVSRNYAPRLHFRGYNYITDWNPLKIPAENRGQMHSYPPLLIASSYWLLRPENDDSEFLKSLAAEKDYHRIVQFKARYVYPAHTILGIAGWSQENMWLSPPISIYQKKQNE